CFGFLRRYRHRYASRVGSSQTCLEVVRQYRQLAVAAFLYRKRPPGIPALWRVRDRPLRIQYLHKATPGYVLPRQANSGRFVVVFPPTVQVALDPFCLRKNSTSYYSKHSSILMKLVAVCELADVSFGK